jgi:hypothetical protein
MKKSGDKSPHSKKESDSGLKTRDSGLLLAEESEPSSEGTVLRAGEV